MSSTATKSKTFTVDGLGSSYNIVLDDLLRIQGVIEDGSVLDPTNTRWDTVVLSDEAKVVWNQLKGTSGQGVSLSPSEISDNFYQTEYAKTLNVAKTPSEIGSSDPTLTGRSVTTDPRRPLQFATPPSVRYKRESTETLAYPIDIDIKQDHLKITKFQYDRGGEVNLSAPGNSFTTEVANGAGKYGGTVILPMPKVSDSNGAEWGDSDLNVFGIAAAGAYSSMIQATGNTTIKDLIDGLGQNFSKAGQFISQNVAGGAGIMGSMVASGALKAVGISVSPDELLARATGKIANPNAELLFQGPILRDFGFSFLMIARSESEGRQIRKIIKWFKQGAAPKYLGNAALLATPDVFKLEYSSDKLNKFRQMALRTITVDYAPDGYWAAYKDSQPIAVLMNLQFTELKPIYDKDQNEVGDDVGY